MCDYSKRSRRFPGKNISLLMSQPAETQTISTPILINLHWLPVEFRIKFKILLLVFKALYSTAPIYIQELVQRYRPAQASFIISSVADGLNWVEAD
ncbi:hypothetical protein AC249_AIPGENE18039 [Exaiptasia diaphana]|nr:hypothetical protein AC249_AIPGENE18039 [Exaiptasia diaphana]